MCAHITFGVPNITLAVPPELHRRMRAHPEIKWSEVVRRVLSRQIQDLERMDALAKRSILRTTDIDALDHLIKEGLRHRYANARRAAGD